MGINGGPLQQRRPRDYDEFTNYINATCFNLKSDKKALTEILSFFIPGCNKGWITVKSKSFWFLFYCILSSTFDVNDSLLEVFTNVALGDYVDFQAAVKPLVDSLTSMNKKNKETLFTMLQAYKGDIKIVSNFIYF